jgi:uncharacterized repeat protein (TIGR03803 family)
MRSRLTRTSLTALAIVALTFSGTAKNAAGQQETVLYSFGSSGNDGQSPAVLTFDASGDIYGTTNLGGTYNAGTVFELQRATGGGWSEKVLHNFDTNGTDGFYPSVGLISDAAGNFYSTTQDGGFFGHGTVYEIGRKTDGAWVERILYSFGAGAEDGTDPQGSVILDSSGNLYGTTSGGGTDGHGTVFELTPKTGGLWSESILYNFGNNGDANLPLSGLVFDSAGNLYGSTYYGGAHNNGAVFELTPASGGGWTESVLYSFNPNGSEGIFPQAGLTIDSRGNLYGTTISGGADLTCYNGGTGTYGCGTVFELSWNTSGGWTETILNSFDNTEGAYPQVGMIFDPEGHLYGATSKGGASDKGVAFELVHQAGGNWTENVLYSFDGTDGSLPDGLTFDRAGHLCGTTAQGGEYGGGNVFKFTRLR